MKKILIIGSMIVVGAMDSRAQALVSIDYDGFDANAFAVTTNSNFGVSGKAYGSGATGYYFELLYSPDLSLTGSPVTVYNPYLGSWIDSGVSGTSGINTLTAGRINSGTSVTVAGWASPSYIYNNPCAVEILGWTANMGTTFSAFLENFQNDTGPDDYYFGYEVGENVAGGGSASLPTVNLWGNQTGGTGLGFNSGLVLQEIEFIPEPTTLVLVGLGGLSLLALRRKK